MKKYILTGMALTFCVSSLLAQNKYTKQADKHYNRLEYLKAIKDYQKVIKRDHGSAYVYKQLATAYYKINDAKNATTYYGQYLDAAEAGSVSPELYYRYAQLLKSQSKDAQSNQYMQKFAELSPNDVRAKAFKANPNYLSELVDSERQYKLEDLDLNTDVQDFGAYEHDGNLYFVSARNRGRKSYGWNGQSTLDVYVAPLAAGKVGEADLLKGDVNSKYNEGAVVITQDGNTMYFTRNDYTNGKYKKSEGGIGQLKIYRATRVDKGWGDVQEVPFNNSEYSTGHVALSPDEQTLYFVSDMPGGYGESDLYRVSINEDGSFGEPENLGSQINTPGKETFPFVDSEGTLYFSSDAHLGLGGLDVFKAEAQGNGFGEVTNMGKDVNSRSDDFSFSYFPEEKRGYVSSNRSGLASEDAVIANDDIYRVIKIQQQEIMIYAKVIDAETGRPITAASVGVYKQNAKMGEKSVDGTATAVFELPGGENHYALQVAATGYHPESVPVKYQPEGKINMVVELQPIEEIIQEEKIVLSPIHFDFDKSAITEQGAFVLDTLVDVMKKHPEMVIHVIAHTDNIGSTAYNQKLSERRAASTVQYIVDHGIDASRITGEGVGESDPAVDCTNCTAEERAQNRQSEFKIVKQ